MRTQQEEKLNYLQTISEIRRWVQQYAGQDFFYLGAEFAPTEEDAEAMLSMTPLEMKRRERIGIIVEAAKQVGSVLKANASTLSAEVMVAAKYSGPDNIITKMQNVILSEVCLQIEAIRQHQARVPVINRLRESYRNNENLVEESYATSE